METFEKLQKALQDWAKVIETLDKNQRRVFYGAVLGGLVGAAEGGNKLAEQILNDAIKEAKLW